MGDEHTTAEGNARHTAARLLRGWGAQAGHLLALITTLALLGVGLVALATGLQAQRDEARRADLLLVVAPAVPGPAFIDHTFELYRRGYAPRLLVAGSGRRQLLDALRERGLPADVAVESESAALAADQVAAIRREQGEEASALVVSQPEELLLTLKITRDMGLRAYGSPPPGRSVDLLTVLRTSAAYWRYVLARQ